MTIGGWVARLGSAVRRVFQRLLGRGADPRPELPTTGVPRPVVTDAEFVELEGTRAEVLEREGRELVQAAEAKARREAEDKARREAEDKARREAEDKARREAEDKARREAEDKARREAEERARLEAELQARAEAEERARLEAEAEEARRVAEEEAARREAEEKARRAAEEQARIEAEARARQEAAERALREEEERARVLAEEQDRRDAAERALREAEEQARLTAAEQARLDAEEQASREAEAEARREDELEAAESRAALEAAEQARYEAEEAMTAEFSSRLAETESLLEAEQAADERLFAEPRAPAAPGTPAAGEVSPAATPEPDPGTASAAAPAGDSAADTAAVRIRTPVDIPGDYVPVAESEHELYRVDVEDFEGPLDLLLFLIRRHAIDVFDIPMAFVCERYLGYLKVMESLNIDVASEFLAMAAELLHIKSKMLLPKPVEVEEEDEVDPRAELVRRLLEYQKYKDAAEQLASLNRTGRDTFGRDPEELPPSEQKAPLAEVGLFALIEAFDTVLKRQKPELRHQVMMEAASVRQRIRALISVFTERHQVPFLELLGDMATRIDVVVTFLSVLEMARLRMLKIYQSTEGTLYLEARFETAEQALERLQGIDTTLDGSPPPGGENG